MQVTVRLLGRLRDYIPAENRGHITLDIASDAVVQDILDNLGINEHVLVAVNDQHESNSKTRLQPNDQVMIFEPVAGG
jgi:sulfur carrier protein ThiS